MKLLYLLPEYVNNAGGGIITFYRHFLPLLAAQGHEVRVIVGSGVSAAADCSPIQVDGVSVENLSEALLHEQFKRFAHYSALPGLRRFLSGAWAMWEQAQQGQGFDAVEASDWGLLFVPWTIEAGPPCVVQLHGSSGQIDLHDPVRGEEVQGTLLRLIEKTAAARATEVQAYSKSNAAVWAAQTGRSIHHVQPAWKPLQAVTPATVRSGKGLVVGRVQHWKGPQVLCEALRLLGSRAPVIDWLGRDMPFGERGRTMATHLREHWPDVWGRSLTHQPQQPPVEAQRLQSQASFVVVPSEWDTFNFTCVEAMAAATPVICSIGAGASELIEDGLNGFLFEQGNARSLAQALERFLCLSEPARIRLGQAARSTALLALDPVANTALRLAAYRRVAEAPLNARSQVPADDWLRLAVAPQPARAESLDFLDLLPLKGLIGYAARRTLQKLGARGQA